MATRFPSKHARDQALDFQGFLTDLQDWELSLKEKDKKMKAQAEEKDVPTARGNVKHSSKLSSSPGVGLRLGQSRSDTRQHEYSRNHDAISRISSSFMTEESLPDAASEKELGNEYFKQRKFKEAIDCYSRSIALLPTAVAYANRAMAYIKIKRFQEAEDDCTEALNLDDRYIKAYSRRATARKELGKFKEATEDAEFALRLEPQNQEIKKQYAEAKSLYEKEILQKASGALKSSVQGLQKVGKSVVEVNADTQGVHSISSSSQGAGEAAIQDHFMVPANTSTSMEETENKGTGNRSKENGYLENAVQNSGLEDVMSNHKTGQREMKSSLQELASRAASRAMVEAAKNITAPNSAYQFEVSWRGLLGDHALQASYLKAISPNALPQIFKNALSAPILIDIIKCIATFFVTEMDLAVKFLDNLTKISRFDMIIMCLSSTDKADLLKIWDEVFCNKATPSGYADTLGKLRPRYCFKQ